MHNFHCHGLKRYFKKYNFKVLDSVVDSMAACHAAGRGSLPGPGVLLGVETWFSTLDIVYLCLSDETQKAVGPLKISHQ